MTKLQVTRLSSKGQVVLPLAVRERLRLQEGEKFIVLGSQDTVILKKIEMPSLNRAKKLLKESKIYAKKARLSLSDVKKAVSKARP